MESSRFSGNRTEILKLPHHCGRAVVYSRTVVRTLALCVVLSITSGSSQAQSNIALAELPITLVDGYVFLKGRINQSVELDFLFDTGCTEPVVDSATAVHLGLATRIQSRTSGQGAYLEAMIDDASLTFGGFALEPRRLLSRSNDLLERRYGVNVDVVIGADLLRDFVIEVDYDRRRLLVYESEGYSHDGRGVSVPINANPYISTLNAELFLGEGESVRGRFLIDTGAGLPLALNTPFVNQHNLVGRFGAPEMEYRLAANGVEMLSYPGRIPGFRIGDHEFANMPVLLSQTLEGPLSPGAIAGIVGNRVWRKFNTVFDYGRNAIYLEPNGFFDEAFEVDCSGLGFEKSTNGRLVVTRVLANSPADSSGLLVGDEIEFLNGRHISTYTMSDVREFLNRSGKTVTLRVGRGSTVLDFSLQLRALY